MVPPHVPSKNFPRYDQIGVSMAVTNKPINNAVKGLDVACKIVSATFFPMCCSDEVIKSSANKKRRNAPRM
jgi:hypothetical protein